MTRSVTLPPSLGGLKKEANTHAKPKPHSERKPRVSQARTRRLEELRGIDVVSICPIFSNLRGIVTPIARTNTPSSHGIRNPPYG